MDYCSKIKGECVCHIHVEGKSYCELGEKFIDDINDCPEVYDSPIDDKETA